MARKAGGARSRPRGSRGGRTGITYQVLGALLLAGLIAAAVWWWQQHHWIPPRDGFPVQGVEIGEADGPVNWRSIKAIGADFAYIDASASAFARDPAFVGNLQGAREAGLQVGALHRYDPCQPADRQAANFVVTVPGDQALLPAAIELDMLADKCPVTVNEAKVESELMTFINQVETHTGKALILKISPAFEARYAIAAKLDRNIWLVRDRWQPDYAGRPWTLWTANSSLSSEVVAGDLRWVVMQP
ncbi:glycoside hydrolase family 25 protein [Novosphingobium colocasiae]|uniref:glycoside hydrolase family 25 protein n=1 Tax=Novosphingobium colocasiae TaxID=1256513 RepID=UPI0035B3147A